jgi:hypothetical protein
MKIQFSWFFPCSRSLAIAIVALLASACSDSDNDNDRDSQKAVPPFQELVEQGVTRYLGMYSPMGTSETGDIVNHHFGEGDGPLCLDGTPYTMATRDEGTEDLLIFLMGGGACWFGLCAATTQARTGIPPAGILNPASPLNPIAGISTVYLPYCDGGIFGSDADVDTDSDGADDRFHRGLRNLSAGLDVAVQNFPAPRRIVLAGVSAGGYGTLFALPIVRQLYPDIPIEVLNDSGIGITRPGDPGWNQDIIDYWNIGSFFPASCPECKAQGSPASMINWQLEQDPNVRLGMLSYTQDFTIGTFFLGIGGPAFEAVLRPTLADVEEANPERMRSFVRTGDSHTFVGGDLSIAVEGVSVSEWIASMINGPPGEWQSVSE